MKMTGLKELNAALKKVGADAIPIVGKMLAGGASLTARAARDLAPVLTGRMRAAIAVKRARTARGRTKVSLTIAGGKFPGFFYPAVVERRRPFMGRAAESMAGRAAREIEQIGRREIEAAAKRARKA